jgi:microcystin-dependent protein
MKRLMTSAALLLFVGAIGIAYTVGRARAYGVPQTGTMSYSGTLMNFGQPDSSSHVITLKLWVGSTVSCTTVPTGSTQLVNGRFTVPLDPSCLPVIHQNPNVQVEVVVDGTSMGLTPLSAVPYAVEADSASNAAPGSALAGLIPAGTVIAYAGPVGGSGKVQPPAGWLLCDGAAVSRSQYAGLFALLGATHGAGDGSTTFNVPDYRGYFLRGWDEGAGRDPDAASRGAMASGGNTGDAIGSVEGGNFASHAHGVNDPGHSHGFFGGSPIGQNGNNPNPTGFNSGGLYAPMGYVGGITNSGTGVSIRASGGAENRPLNANVAYLIKY